MSAWDWAQEIPSFLQRKPEVRLNGNLSSRVPLACGGVAEEDEGEEVRIGNGVQSTIS